MEHDEDCLCDDCIDYREDLEAERDRVFDETNALGRGRF